jgi:nucleotide-binding universal stress UspA family protein
MRILVALDRHTYSAGIVNDVAKLAANTWADVTLLGVQTSGGPISLEDSLTQALLQYKKVFLSHFAADDLPYSESSNNESIEGQKGRWVVGGGGQTGRKALSLIIRQGDPTREIIAEAKEQESDLIVLGCTSGSDCHWEGEPHLPQKIARQAPYSVLVIKEVKRPKKVICCLDQAHISQESLEMINQIVTLHRADLKIIGLTGPKGLRGNDDAEKKINDIVKYYMSRSIKTWIKLVKTEALAAYAEQASHEGLIALWLGKKSLLKKIFVKDFVDVLISTSQSSVLLLK